MNPKDLVNRLTDSEPVMRSCRAAIFRSNGEKLQVLLACNTGIDEWSLPGSTLQESNETAQQSAERGLFEETGIFTTVDFLMNEDAQFIPRAIFYAAVESATEPLKEDARWVDVDMLKECDPPLDAHDIQAIEAALKKVHDPDAIIAEAFEKMTVKLAIVGVDPASSESVSVLRAMRGLDHITEVILVGQQPNLTSDALKKKAFEAIEAGRSIDPDLIESIIKLPKK